MRFAVIGGDRRSALLCPMLAADGHKVSAYALELAELGTEIQKSSCLQSCVYSADCVVLPAPAEKSGLLNAPFSQVKLPLEELFAALWPGQTVCGGKFSQSSCAAAQRGKLRLEDVLTRSTYTAKNAAITAEGALGLLLGESEKTLYESRVLICGWGRIGQLLAAKLSLLGAEVSVAERSENQRAMASALGYTALDFSRLEGEMAAFDAVVNTVPARVLGDAALCLAKDGALLIELASPPGGFDKLLAENIGLKVLSAPGLPGKSAPRSAAALMKETVYEILGEQEE